MSVTRIYPTSHPRHRLKRHGKYLFHVTKHGFILYGLSLAIVSLAAGTMGMLGKKRPVVGAPSGEYRQVHFTSEARDGLELEGWYLPAAGDKVLVIAPGWGGNRGTLLSLAEAVQRAGTSVLTYDPRGGTGRNTYGQREAGDLAGAVSWVRNEYGFAADEVAVLGHSMGGAAAVSFASTHDLGGLVLVSSVYDLRKTREFFANEYHLLFPRVYAAGATLVEKWIYGLRPTNPITLLPSETVPTLILHGEDDPKAPIEDVYAVRDSALHPRVLTVPGAGHTYFLDNEEGQRRMAEETILFIVLL